MNTLSSAQGSTEPKPLVKEFLLTGNPNQHKSIFVFLDGTANNPKSGTNVWRLFELISANKDPQTTALYIEGVGGINDSPWREITGKLFGRGMQDRILEGYDFIANHYNPGDDIYLFGFSRGAHEARSLAGFLAYTGVPVTSIGNTDKERKKIWKKVLKLTKSKNDKDYLDEWALWKPGQTPLLAAEIKDQLKLEMRAVEITFLGIWDTVPGSSFKDFGPCKEKEDIKEGDRYKSHSYPVIHHIAHAVSLDEKRSKFRPLLVCPAINSAYTKIDEVWFPGAHADVGGGYEDSEKELPGISLKGLPGISLNWMLGLLAKSYSFNKLPSVEEDAKGLAHWPICDFVNKVNKFEDRDPKSNKEWVDLREPQFHPSVQERENAGQVPICIQKKVYYKPYPVIPPPECSIQASIKNIFRKICKEE